MRNLLGAIEEHKWQQIYLHQNVHNIIGSPVGNKTPSSTLTQKKPEKGRDRPSLRNPKVRPNSAPSPGPHKRGKQCKFKSYCSSHWTPRLPIPFFVDITFLGIANRQISSVSIIEIVKHLEKFYEYIGWTSYIPDIPTSKAEGLTHMSRLMITITSCFRPYL